MTFGRLLMAIGTAVAATRIGIVIFAIPFLFALNPEMLIVAEGGAEFSLMAFLYLILRLALLIYMLASAAARFDKGRMAIWESLARAAAGLALISPVLMVSGAAVVACVALVGVHHMVLNRKVATA